MRSRALFLILTLLVHTTSPVFAVEDTSSSVYSGLSKKNQKIVSNLERQLEIERLYFYILKQSERFEKTNPKLSVALARLASPTLIFSDFKTVSLKDPDNYDRLIYSWLQSQHPELQVKQAEINWGWNFLKNSLRESYTLKFDTQEAENNDDELAPIEPPQHSTYTLNRVPKDAVLTLDFQSYTSDRTTLAAFLVAKEIGLKIYIGSHKDFHWDLDRTGAKILAEIKPRARNYNKIYLIQEADGSLRIAITGVSGQDRLNHLLLTMSWAHRDTESDIDVEVIGDTNQFLNEQESQLTKQLLNLPKADQVFIGQKGAWESALLVVAKLQDIIEYKKIFPKKFKSKLSTDDFNKITAILSSVKSGKSLFHFLDQKSLIESVAKQLEDSDNQFSKSVRQFNIDNPSHEFSDILLQVRRGKIQRWRFFSNVWGDELRPIARALRHTGHDQITYIGTAGALPNRQIEVGDLVYATEITNHNDTYQLSGPHIVWPKGVLRTARVTQVDSPLRETMDWLNQETADVVEIEAADLAETFQGQLDGIHVYLLISDVLNTQHTLDAADSGVRKANQQLLIQTLVDHYGIRAVIEPADENSVYSHIPVKKLRLALQERDLPARFQLAQALKLIDINDENAVANLLKSQKSFTTRFLEDRLEDLEHHLVELKNALEEFGLHSTLYLNNQFLSGTYNPKSEPFQILLRVRSASALSSVRQLLADFYSRHNGLDKILSVQAARGPPDDNWVQLPWAEVSERGELRKIYADVALRLGNLAIVETRSHRMRFVQIPEGAPDTHVAFFEPDPSTLEWLKKLTTQSTEPKTVLKDEIKRLNDLAKENGFIYKITLEEVSNLPNGSWAIITADMSDNENPQIILKITAEGLKNPVVILEELIHLQQITDSPLLWTKKMKSLQSFVHPYHWVEVSENARLGSAKSQLRLAQLEIEAIEASQYAYKHYSKHFGNKPLSADLEQYFEARLEHAESRLALLSKTYRNWLRKARDQFQAQKLKWNELEARSMKLNDLIAKNDRVGVRKLIEAYLPWPLMEPLEKQAWLNWLDSIESPRQNQRVLVFRGMYDDTVGRNENGEPYLMSTVLTRNQGSYTRRLRSLATLRERFAQTLHRSSEKSDFPFRTSTTRPASISVLMLNHSIEAEGSPFLSTSNLDVAFQFGPRQIGAFLMDPRRLVLNALPLPKYAYQEERLTPLVIFPDEIVLFHDYKKDDRGISIVKPEERKADFLKMLEMKIGRKITRAEKSGSGNTRGFLKAALKMWRETLTTSPKNQDAHQPKNSKSGKNRSCKTTLT